MGLAVFATVLAGFAPFMSSGRATAQEVAIDHGDIGGVVTGPGGAEAGVWVITETKELGTRFIKIVVTDGSGRYVLPDLPNAAYDIWVRGYGLIDSPKVTRSQWLNYMKSNGCVGCHQMGNLVTRTIPAALGKFESSEQAWMRRVQSGQAGGVRPSSARQGARTRAFTGRWSEAIRVSGVS